MNYSNTNQGVLFPNDKKGNEKRPDYKGTINVNGTDYWLSGWIKASKAGAKYMSLSIQPKEGETAKKPAGMPEVMSPSEIPRGGLPEFNDDIPF